MTNAPILSILDDVVPHTLPIPPANAGETRKKAVNLSGDVVVNCRRGIPFLLLVSFVVPMLSGCATILSDRKYPVAFENSGGPTYFAVRNRKNEIVHQGVTPQQVTLDSKAAPFWPAKYNVTFAGQGDFVEQRELKANIDPWVAGNILFGGIPGTVVDGATGAMWKLPARVAGEVPTNLAMTDVTQGAKIAATVNAGQSDASKSGIAQVKYQTASPDLDVAMKPKSPSTIGSQPIPSYKQGASSSYAPAQPNSIDSFRQ